LGSVFAGVMANAVLVCNSGYEGGLHGVIYGYKLLIQRRGIPI